MRLNLERWLRSCASISNGIGAGVVTYVLLKMAKGKFKAVHPLLYGVAALFVLYFLRGPAREGMPLRRFAGSYRSSPTTRCSSTLQELICVRS